ncbi:hypothetical protein BH24DEI2_BH24DEI2_01780 [soil metagenome]
MTLSHDVSFTFDLNLPPAAAVRFVRDAETSLSKADFIENLQVVDDVVSAHLPVNAALFGQQRLEFSSRLHPTEHGARLAALPLDTDAPGWAEVAGEAQVESAPGGSTVEYTFAITIHLKLPTPEKWGVKALVKMIEFTAQRVLENITANFPAAVQAAAHEAEAAYAA